MKKNIVKSLGILSALMTSSCAPQMLTVIEKETFDLSYLNEKGRLEKYHMGVLYFDADGHEETAEYLGIVEMPSSKDSVVQQRTQFYKQIKICDQDTKDIWLKKVDNLIRNYE